MKKITVFTPTYNRAYTLKRLYESLLRQTNQDFLWLIVDDGSTDNTGEIVKKWQEEQKIEIIYIYQENQGVSAAHNTAYKIINTELNMCVDSDDYLVDNAIEIILKKWNECDKKNTAGIIGLDAYPDGTIVGTKLPTDKKTDKIYNLYYKEGVKGDKKLIYRTELSKEFEYKITENEKFVSAGCKYYKIDQICELNIFNEVLCIVEYLKDGLTKNAKNTFLKNPNGNIEYAKVILEIPNATKLDKIKWAIHYVGNSYVIESRRKIKKGKGKIYTIIFYPLGIIWGIVIKKKIKKL